MPTLEGGLRIDAEDAGDWDLLRSIIQDARGTGPDLAERLGGWIQDEHGGEDWRELVVPDLREEFHSQLVAVARAIDQASDDCGGEAGPVWIRREEGFLWYSALNQARLALEERFSFDDGVGEEAPERPPRQRSAFLRSHFYLAIQSLILEHVLQ